MIILKFMRLLCLLGNLMEAAETCQKYVKHDYFHLKPSFDTIALKYYHSNFKMMTKELITYKFATVVKLQESKQKLCLSKTGLKILLSKHQLLKPNL